MTEPIMNPWNSFWIVNAPERLCPLAIGYSAYALTDVDGSFRKCRAGFNNGGFSEARFAESAGHLHKMRVDGDGTPEGNYLTPSRPEDFTVDGVVVDVKFFFYPRTRAEVTPRPMVDSLLRFGPHELPLKGESNV